MFVCLEDIIVIYCLFIGKRAIAAKGIYHGEYIYEYHGEFITPGEGCKH